MRVTFQSRFGPAQWLEPYTEPTLQALARGGLRRADVVTPGFVADCLETLEEIGLGAREAFLDSGGQAFHRITSYNVCYTKLLRTCSRLMPRFNLSIMSCDT